METPTLSGPSLSSVTSGLRLPGIGLPLLCCRSQLEQVVECEMQALTIEVVFEALHDVGSPVLLAI